jgi:hypothetical protein
MALVHSVGKNTYRFRPDSPFLGSHIVSLKRQLDANESKKLERAMGGQKGCNSLEYCHRGRRRRWHKGQIGSHQLALSAAQIAIMLKPLS